MDPTLRIISVDYNTHYALRIRMNLTPVLVRMLKALPSFTTHSNF